MSNRITITTRRPQPDKEDVWELYWFHRSDLDASYPADSETLARAGYVPAAEVAAPPGEQWKQPGESFPEERQFAWVEIPGHALMVMQWNSHHWWGLDHRGQSVAFRMSHVTRFCPLPAPPKGTP